MNNDSDKDLRPALSTLTDRKSLCEYYFLKEELITFCRENGLPSSGRKAELTERIAYYLDTGKVLKQTVTKPKRKSGSCDEIREDSIIETDFVCSEKNRAFFREKIGKGFSFNVSFQKWLRSNAGKTYGDAIKAYYRIRKDQKKEKSVIAPEFEYNTYIRDFFADNPGKKLPDAIRCWNYKKRMKGSHRYESADLSVLKTEEAGG